MFNTQPFLWRLFPRKGLTSLYVAIALRYFAISLLAIFVPLYLYKEMSFSLEQTLLFYIFYALVFAIGTPLAAKFASRYGVRWSVFVSVPLYLGFIGTLYGLKFISIPLTLIASFLGLSLAFYWMGIHHLFLFASHNNHRGEEVGKREGVAVFASLVGPVTGGLLIKFFGFKIVFLITTLVLLLSMMFILRNKEKHIQYTFSFKGLVNTKYWGNSLFFVSRGTRVMAEGVLWPLFVFSILNDYLSLGIVDSILSGTTGILMVMSGMYSDKVDKRKIVMWTTAFDSLGWFIRAIVSTVTGVFGVTVFGAITNGLREPSIGALEYDKARGDATAYFVSREVYICLGRILLLVFVLLVNSISGGLLFQGFMNLAALLF